MSPVGKTGSSSIRDRIRQRAESRQGHGSGSSYLKLPEGLEWFQPKKGTSTIDILPYRVSIDGHPEVKKGELWYQRTFFIHRDVGVNEERFICPRTVGKACPICEEHSRLRKDPSADEDLVKALRAKERELFNIVDLEADPDKVLLWECSYHLFGKYLEEEIREGSVEMAGFADLETGLSLRVRFREESMGENTFLEAGKIEFVPRENPYTEEVLGLVYDLDSLLVVPSYEMLQRQFLQVAAGDAEQEAPAPTAPKTATRPSSTLRRGPAPAPAAPEPEEAEPAAEAEPEGEVCVACEGTKKNSMGRPCAICHGTGKMNVAGAAEEEPAPQRPAPTQGRRSTAGSPVKAAPSAHPPVQGADGWADDEPKAPAKPPASGGGLRRRN